MSIETHAQLYVIETEKRKIRKNISKITHAHVRLKKTLT